MAQEQLQQAYQLIRAGRIQEAIQMLEPILRSDPNNRDAWWLLANATNDADAKRRALNEVLRLGSDDSRAEKARQLLATLPADLFGDLDPIPLPGASRPAYDEFSLPGSPSQSQPVYAQGQKLYDDDYAPRSPASGPSCWVVGLAVVGVITLLCCGGTFFTMTFLSAQVTTFLENIGVDIQQWEELETAGASDEELAEAVLNDIFSEGGALSELGVDTEALSELGIDTSNIGESFGDMVGAFETLPDAITDLGPIDLGQTVAGDIATAEQIDGYRLSLGEMRDVQITLTLPAFSVPPSVLVYDAEGAYLDANDPLESADGLTYTYTYNGLSAGEYTITVRSLFGLGVSPYELTVA